MDIPSILRRHRRLGLCSLGVLLTLIACTSKPAPSISQPSPSRTPAVPAGAPVDFPLQVPAGYRISIYARDLGEARMIAFDAQGVPYVTIMNRGVREGGKVVALPDRDHNGMADEVIPVIEHLHRPHGLVFHDGHMYVSDPERIYRLLDDDGDLRADRTETVVEGMSGQDDHWARPFVFDSDGNIVVAIGSTCDVCQEGNKTRATISRYKLDGSRPEVVARGLRSVVGLAWRPGTDELWAVNNERDSIGPEAPPDTALIVREGSHYGWPYCYGDRVVDQAVLANPDIGTPDKTPKDEFCRTKMTPATMLLPPHVAPLTLDFYDATQFPADMRGGMFMAWHGAFDFSTTTGYRVTFVPFKDGQPQAPQDFVTGWLKPDGDRWYARPTGVAIGPEGSLYITDDVRGNVYRVDYVGTP
jgi:glucose/arabinose dehydrogenase